MSKKVVSIAVFGHGDKYARYLPAFIRAHLNLFPNRDGWRLRVHCDNIVTETYHGRTLLRLGAAGLIDVIYMGPAVLTKAMLWRMAPVFDSDAGYVFCRDLDACPMPRDRAVMDQFIASGATVHTVHDHIMHMGIMGGLCGFHAPSFKEMTGIKSLETLYEVAGNVQWAKHGTDQNVLNQICLREGGPPLLEHRYSGWVSGQPTTAKRESGSYPCQSWSARIPDVGTSNFEIKEAVQADQLANHLGAAGFNHNAAVEFYDKNGTMEVAAIMTACEHVGGSLMKYAYNKYSQNGEDGILQEILTRLEIPEPGVFVEFGVGDGQNLSNTLKLAERGWRGVWIEENKGSFHKMRALAETFDDRVTPYFGTVGFDEKDSLDSFLDRAFIPHLFDFMSIDIDSYDLQVWEACKKYSAKIVLIEINSAIPVGVHQVHVRGDENAQGASFTSMVELAQSKGYKLVCHTGNLFFVLEALFDKLHLPNRENDPNVLFNNSWALGAAKAAAEAAK